MNVIVVVLACIGSFILGRKSMRLVMDQRLDQGRKELAEKRERLMALRDELMGIADDLSNKESALKQMRQKLDVALGDIARDEKLDAVVQNVPDQPVAVSGCIDITDKAIEKLQ